MWPPAAAAADEGGAHAHGSERPVFAFEFGTHELRPSGFEFPGGVAFGPDGAMAVVDRSADRVQVFDANGTFAYQLGSEEGNGRGEFNNPYGVAFGPNGTVAVAAVVENVP